MNKTKIMLLQSYICVASASAAIITPALPHIERAYALSHGSIEWVVSIFLLGYVLGQLIYGPLANRYGRLPALRSGLLINLVGIVICLIAVSIGSYYVLLLGRLITALGAAAGLACTFILINELLSKEQAKQAMSFALVFFTVGIGLSVTLAGIVTQYFHWQYCFWILLFHGIFMFISTWQFPETLTNPKPLQVSTILIGFRQALESKQLIKYALIVGLNSAVAYCYSAAAPIYTQSILHLSASQYGYWNLFNIIGMFASGFLSANLMKRWSAEKVLLCALARMVPCIFSLMILSNAAHPNAFWFFSTTLFLYLFSGLLFPAGSFLASNAISDKASASSMMSFIYMGSAMLSVIIMGYLPLSTLLALITVITSFLIFAWYLLLSEKSFFHFFGNKIGADLAE